MSSDDVRIGDRGYRPPVEQQRPVVPLLLLCGAPGAGKSSVAWEIYFSLLRSREPVANLDLDVVGYGPPPRRSVPWR